MLKTLVKDFLEFEPNFLGGLAEYFSRLSRNFRSQLAGLEQIAAGGRLSRRLRGLVRVFITGHGLPSVNWDFESIIQVMVHLTSVAYVLAEACMADMYAT